MAGICILQFLTCVVGVFMNNRHMRCDLTARFGDDQLNIDCKHCIAKGGISHNDWAVAVLGCGVACAGMYAANTAQRQYVKLYGFITLAMAFVLGTAAFFIALEIPTLELIKYENKIALSLDEKCAGNLELMLSDAWNHALSYGMNTTLAALGAIFAMWSHVYFDFEAHSTPPCFDEESAPLKSPLDI